MRQRLALAGLCLVALAAPLSAADADSPRDLAPVAAQQITDTPAPPPLATLTVTPHSGHSYLVAGDLSMTLDSSSPASVLLAIFGLECDGQTRSGSPTAPQAFSQAENLVRGQTTHVSPAFIASVHGLVRMTCVLKVRFMRPRETSGTNLIDVGPNGWLSLSGPLAPGSAQQRGGTSFLMTPSTTRPALARAWTVPRRGASLDMIGEVELTACTAVNGSRDASTGGRELCQGWKDPNQPSTVGLQIVVRQRPLVRRAQCPAAAWPPLEYTTTIDASTHHAIVRLERRLSVTRRPGCSSVLTVSLRIHSIGGAPVVVNEPQSVLALVPEE